MTARAKKPAKSVTREDVLKAALKHVPFDGFTDTVLERAGKEAGASKDDLARLFPEGPLDLVEAFSDWADAEMEAALAKKKLAAMKIRDRIRTAVWARIEALRTDKEAARRAGAFLTLPPHAATGAKLLYRSVDRMWRAVGDTSTDFNFYTKRAILAGVYSAVTLHWFADQSDGDADTWAFLDRRIADVMRIEKVKASVKKATNWLPDPVGLLGRLRYGRG